MTHRTILGAGLVINDDRLAIELIHAIHRRPARVAILWPQHPSICDPREFGQATADATRILALAATSIANLKARRVL
jgi:hypothetical protein